MHAWPVHTRRIGAKNAVIPPCPFPIHHGVPHIVLTAPLSYAAVGLHHD